MFSLAGLAPLPVTVKDARRALAARAGAGARLRRPAGRARRPPPRAARAGRRQPRRRARGARAVVGVVPSAGAARPCCAASTSRSRPASASRCWDATAPARARCCKVAAGLLAPTAARVRARATSRCCSSTRATTSCTSASATSCPPDGARARAGLAHLADRDPRDLSGGERQRLALGDRAGGGTSGPPVVVPRRADARHGPRAQGRARRAAPAARRRRAARSSSRRTTSSSRRAFATRCVLLGDGRPVADGPTAEVLARRPVLRDRGRAGARAARGCCRRRARALLRREAPGEAGDRALSARCDV